MYIFLLHIKDFIKYTFTFPWHKYFKTCPGTLSTTAVKVQKEIENKELQMIYLI